MKPKHFLLFTLGMFLVTLIACSKDSDGLDEDFSPISTTERSKDQLRIRYDMSTSQNIKPTTGTIQDLCPLDIKILTVPSSTSSVSTTMGPDGQVCMSFIDEVLEPGGKKSRPGRGNKTTTKYCNGVLSFTDTDGTKTVVDAELDVSMFQSIYQSYYYTEEQQDSAMNVMILDAQKEGATVTTNGNALTITQVDEEGNTETVVYDIENHVVVSSSHVDPNGNVKTKTTLGYRCTPDGRVVPDYVISYDYNDNMICSDPIYNIEQVKFDNFQITL